MITQGQDPTDLVKKIAAVIQARQKGIQIEDAIEEIFAPENPPAGAEQQVEQPSVPSAPGAPVGGSPQAAPQAGAPDIQTLLAGLGSQGQPTGGVSTKQATPIR
jgi:hypothetical protein